MAADLDAGGSVVSDELERRLDQISALLEERDQLRAERDYYRQMADEKGTLVHELALDRERANALADHLEMAQSELAGERERHERTSAELNDCISRLEHVIALAIGRIERGEPGAALTGLRAGRTE